jgi:hypothetical protein
MIRAEFPASHQAILGPRGRRNSPMNSAISRDDLIATTSEPFWTPPDDAAVICRSSAATRQHRR